LLNNAIPRLKTASALGSGFAVDDQGIEIEGSSGSGSDEQPATNVSELRPKRTMVRFMANFRRFVAPTPSISDKVSSYIIGSKGRVKQDFIRR
jgi:hypothetical protein